MAVSNPQFVSSSRTRPSEGNFTKDAFSQSFNKPLFLSHLGQVSTNKVFMVRGLCGRSIYKEQREISGLVMHAIHKHA